VKSDKATSTPAPAVVSGEEPSEKDAHGAHTVEEHYAPHANGDADPEKPKIGQDENGSSGADTTAGIVPENAESADADEDKIVYPNGVQLTLLTVGLCLATFTVALDNTIIGEHAFMLSSIAEISQLQPKLTLPLSDCHP
jgi:hypothetical protein